MAVLGNRINKTAHAASHARHVEVVHALAAAPAVVLASNDPTDLFPLVLADVADPELAGQYVEAPAPRVPETPGIDLGAVAAAKALYTGICRVYLERILIIHGNGVGHAAIDINTRHRAKQVCRVLCAVIGIAAAAAVAPARIQETVGTESDVPAVVIAGWRPAGSS